MSEPHALEIDGLTVRYGATVAVDALDLSLPAGQTVALLGPNGAGKSTILNTALGLLRLTAGSVRVLGRDAQDAVHAGCVGAMSQHGGLPSEARVCSRSRSPGRRRCWCSTSRPRPWTSRDGGPSGDDARPGRPRPHRRLRHPPPRRGRRGRARVEAARAAEKRGWL